MLGPGFDDLELGHVTLPLELAILCAFLLGYLSSRGNLFNMHRVTGKEASSGVHNEGGNTTLSTAATIQDEIVMGNYEAAVRIWRVNKTCLCTPAETLRLVLKALRRSNSGNVVEEIVEHMSLHSCHLNNPTVASAVLDAACNEGDLALMESLLARFEQHFGMLNMPQVQEAMISAYAAADALGRLSEFIERVHAMGHKVTLRGYSLSLRGFIKNKNLDAVLCQSKSAISQGYLIPPFAVAGVFRLACDMNCLAEVLNKTQELGLTPSMNTVSDLMKFCELQEDAVMAKRIQLLTFSAKM